MPQAFVFAIGSFLSAYSAVATIGVFIMANAAIIASTVLLVGGMAYSASKAKKAKQAAKDAYNAAQVDRLVNVSSSIAPRELVMGRVRKGGAIMYKGSTGSHQKDFYLVVALAGNEIDAVEQIWLNDQFVTLDAFGNVTDAPYGATRTVTGFANIAAGQTTITLPPEYIAGTVSASMAGLTSDEGDVPVQFSINGFDLTTVFSALSNGILVSYQYTVADSAVKITTHLGQPGQAADAALMAAFPADWTAADTLQGVAYLVAKFTYSETAFPSGLPNVTATIRGAKMYDPRTGTPSYSENPALMMRHVYTHPKFGKATPSAAEDARIVVAANACDITGAYAVGSAGGLIGQIINAIAVTAPLYRASLVLPFGTSAESGLDDLAQAMGGSWAHMGGELFVKAGVYTSPVMPLTDNDLAGIQRDGMAETQRPISIGVHRERAQKFNTVKVKIWDSAQDYKQVSLTPLVGAALLTRDGTELVQEVMFPAIGFSPQALHVAGIMMRDARDPLVIELPVKLTMYRVELFDIVEVTLPRYGWVAKPFMLLGRSWNSDGTLKFTMKETSASITQMDAGFLAQGFAVNTNLPKPWDIQKVGALTVESGTAELVVQYDGTVISRMRISWPQSTDIAVRQNGQIEVQYCLATNGVAWESRLVPGDETQFVTSEVADGAIYLIRARAKTSLAVSDWNTQVTHKVIGKTEPPPPFDTFLVMAQPDGTRQFNFGYTTTAKPVDWQGAQIRYTSGDIVSPVWEDMTPLQDGTSFYTASPIEANAPMAGEYTFACRSMDTTGNLSTALLDNIILSKRRTGNVFDEFDEQLTGWTGARSGFNIIDGILEAIDSTTWTTAPATWDAWTRWNLNPTSPCTYTTVNYDLATNLTGQVDAVIDADGTQLLEMATSADGTTWSAWGSAASAFTSRWVRLRLTITATGGMPVPVVRGFYWTVSADMKREYINDLVISGLTGFYRIAVGDIRVPLANTYIIIKRIGITIQDSRAGSWTYQRIDNVLTYGPRFQFKLNGTLTDPSFVDFDIEGI